MKYFSMFSGIGGFEYGIRQAHQTTNQDARRDMPNTGSIGRGGSNQEEANDRSVCIGYSEIDKYASSIYRKHFPTHKNYGDATTIITADLPDFDLLIGGFPCQPFSQAGLKMGFDEIRGTLFFDILRILNAKRPECFLLENVKHYLGHDKGRTFSLTVNHLTDCGYKVFHKVLAAKDFGLPQNRERLYIVGFLDNNIEFQFPEKIRSKKKVGDILESDVDEKYTISDRLWKGHKRRRREHKAKGNGFGYTLFSEESEYTNTISARYYKDGSEILIEQKGKNPRKLTPRECERLQGFPDGWTEYGIDKNGQQVCISDTQRYKCLGNAVSTNVIHRIFVEGFTGLL